MNNLTIFYADDDIDDLELFKKAVELSEIKASLHLFNSGDEFLKGIQQNAGDQNLVFLDINMPGKSGLAVLKEMRTMPTLKDIPVVMYSTSNDRNAVMASRAMGANLYVVKPRNFNSLIDIIKKVSTIKWETFVENSTNFVLNQ